MERTELLTKYNLPTPRYTSYPTVPYWDEEPIPPEKWSVLVKDVFDKTNSKNGISLYIHLPFCESLCTFCGCNKRISKTHDVEMPYIRSVHKEWKKYLSVFGSTPVIKELHLGGGTPTFFSAQNLKYLIDGILADSITTENTELSLEAHPNVTSNEQLETLYSLGFRRLSLGVQDVNQQIQYVLNRIQPQENVENVSEYARKVGFTSVNFDLVYGLPLQTEETVTETIKAVKKVMPERIAYYSYAHVPWKSPVQRRFSDDDLPNPDKKRRLYELGRDLLEEIGYVEIGMDHFSLPSDTLYKAMVENKLHRNFMGYTSNYTELLLGLGVSSISDTWTSFMQNNKVLEQYMKEVEEDKFPIFSGHVLTEEDMVLRRHILNLMCSFKTNWENEELVHPSLYEGLERMKELEKDGLVNVYPKSIEVTHAGKAFVRNICMALDSKLWKKQPSSQLFSKAI